MEIGKRRQHESASRLIATKRKPSALLLLSRDRSRFYYGTSSHVEGSCSPALPPLPSPSSVCRHEFDSRAYREKNLDQLSVNCCCIPSMTQYIIDTEGLLLGSATEQPFVDRYSLYGEGVTIVFATYRRGVEPTSNSLTLPLPSSYYHRRPFSCFYNSARHYERPKESRNTALMVGFPFPPAPCSLTK